MERPNASVRWIVNADDFGRSPTINQAVEKAHQEGILTTASLMVNEPSCADAVSIAKRNPNLGVGLHIALCHGTAAVKSCLTGRDNKFARGPVTVGLKIFFSTRFKKAVEAEIEEQFNRFAATGLKLDHVNGHLNIHLHPSVLAILLRKARKFGLSGLRVTDDPFSIDKRLSHGNLAYRTSHAFIYKILSDNADSKLGPLNIKRTDKVFGLLRNDRMDEDFYLRLLPLLGPGVYELYSHPSLDASIHELNALTSAQVKQAVRDHNVQLIRYQDL